MDAGLHVVRGDLLDHLSAGLDVDDTLVDAHLIGIPGLGTLTVRSLSSGDLQYLGRQSDGAGNRVGDILGALNQLGASSLGLLDISRSDGDSNLDDLLLDLLGLFLVVAHVD